MILVLIDPILCCHNEGDKVGLSFAVNFHFWIDNKCSDGLFLIES